MKEIICIIGGSLYYRLRSLFPYSFGKIYHHMFSGQCGSFLVLEALGTCRIYSLRRRKYEPKRM